MSSAVATRQSFFSTSQVDPGIAAVVGPSDATVEAPTGAEAKGKTKGKAKDKTKAKATREGEESNGDEIHADYGDGTGEAFHPGAEGDETDDDEKQDDNALFHGRLNKSNETASAQRPKEIDSLWNTVYPKIQNWWSKSGQELSQREKHSLEETNGKIKAICESMVEADQPKDGNVDVRGRTAALYRQFQFPYQHIYGQIQTLKISFNIIDDEKKDGENIKDEERSEYEAHLANLRAKLGSGVAVLQETLKRNNIPPEKIMNKLAERLFAEALEGEAKKAYESTQAEISKPTQDQQNTWAICARNMHDIVQIAESTMPTDSDANRAKALMSYLYRQQELLRSSNQKLDGNQPKNHLPISLLEQLIDDWSNGSTRGLEVTRESLFQRLQQQPLAETLWKTLQDNTSDVEKILGPPQQGRLAIMPRLPPGNRPSASEATPPVSEATPPVGEATPPVGEATPPVSEATPPVRSEVSPPAIPHATLQSGIPTDPSLLELQMMAQTLQSGVSATFNYANGNTEFGSLEAVRPCRTDNVRFSRFILNAGTKLKPYFVMVKGSELFPGGAEALSEQATEQGKDASFDYKSRKAELKKSANYVKSVGPCLELPRSEAYSPRAGVKTRRQDAYIKIEYNDNGKPVDWLSRSEYSQLVGVRRCERDFKDKLDIFANTAKFMSACKQARMHPDTLQPLTESDRTESPWLCSD